MEILEDERTGVAELQLDGGLHIVEANEPGVIGNDFDRAQRAPNGCWRAPERTGLEK